MIVQKEETSDSNPWENVDHNDSLPHGDAGQPLRCFLGLSVRLKPFRGHEYASRRCFKAEPEQSYDTTVLIIRPVCRRLTNYMASRSAVLLGLLPESNPTTDY